VNLIPFLTQPSATKPHDRLFWRAGAQHAARVGDWKLVDSRTEEPMLFNLRDDISEQNNLAASNPQKLEELQAAFAEWEKGTQPAKWVRQDGRTEGVASKAKAKGNATSAAGSRIQEALKAADKNGDGKLSQEEFPQPAIFKDVDKDNDGFATREEIQSYYTARRNPGASKQ
jgi:hypothetical protein